MYLTGNTRLSLDSKVRFTLPADYRKEFADGRVVLVPIEDALWGFTPEGHKAYVKSLFPDGFNPRNKRDAMLKRYMTVRSKTVELDSAGRLNLGKIDAGIREKVGIEHDIVVAGNDDHLEIWSAAKWDEELGSLDAEDLDALLFTE